MKLLKIFLFSVFMASTASLSAKAVSCRVVGDGVAGCSDDGVGASIYTFKKDGSWVKKTMVRGFDRGYPKIVIVDKLTRPETWPCTRKDDDSGCYEVIGGDCEGRLGYFVGLILGGKPLCIAGSEYSVPFDMMGDKEPVGIVECQSTTHVVTRRYNPVIDMLSDMKDYDGLPPGSYCEDFLATDALYWKP